MKRYIADGLAVVILFAPFVLGVAITAHVQHWN